MRFIQQRLFIFIFLICTPTQLFAQETDAEVPVKVSEVMKPLSEEVKKKMADVFVNAIVTLEGGDLPANAIAQINKNALEEASESKLFQWDQIQLDNFKNNPKIFKESVDFLSKPSVNDVRSKKLVGAFYEGLKKVNEDSKLEDKLSLHGISVIVRHQLEYRVSMKNTSLLKKLVTNLVEKNKSDFTDFKFKDDQMFTNLSGQKLAWKTLKANKIGDPVILSPEELAGKYLVLYNDGSVKRLDEKQVKILLSMKK